MREIKFRNLETWFPVFTLIILGSGILSSIGLFELRAEEPRRALVSLEMMLSGNYINPQLHGLPYYNKLPLFNWILVLFFKLFNSSSEWVVRLPSVLCFIGTAMLIYFLGKKFMDKRAGLIAATFFLTFGDLMFYGSVVAGEIDLFFTLVIFLQVGTIFLFGRKGSFWKMYFLSYLFMSIGVMTKGLPAIAFQFFSLIAISIFMKNFRVLFSMKHLAGIFVFVFALGGYFYTYSLSGDWLTLLANTINESAKSSVVEYGIIDIIKTIINIPVRLLFQLLLPWSLLFFLLISKKIREKIWSNELTRFSILFIILNIVVYILSPGTRNRYLYPFFPFFAILLAFLFENYFTRQEKLAGWIDKIWNILLLLICLGSVGLIFLPQLRILHGFYVYYTIFILCFAGIIYYYYFGNLKPYFRLWLFILAFVLVRFEYNAFYLRYLNNEVLSCKSCTKEMLEITREEPIYLTGSPRYLETTLGIGPVLFENLNTRIEYPTRLPFQIPYYYTSLTGKIMNYKKDGLLPGEYYLTVSNDLPEGKVVEIYRFECSALKDEYVLFQLAE